MCLKTKNLSELIAEQDITCYKIVYRKKRGTILRTYFNNFPIKKLRKYKSKIIKSRRPYNNYQLITQALHSCPTIEDAKKVYMGNDENEISYIIKSIIPKGSIYYIGTFGSDLIPSYASNTLYYTDELIYCFENEYYEFK